MKFKCLLLLAVLLLFVISALAAQIPCAGGMWNGYAVYNGSWPAGPHYRHIQLTYGDLNPFNVPDPDASGYWPYPSPFVLFPNGIVIDPLGIPLDTIGDNYAMGSTDARIYQQWACYPGTGVGLYTLWFFLRVGPEPAPGEILPPNVYFMRPFPYEGLGNYYIIYNSIVDCCEAGVTEGSIGFWGNWKNHFSEDEMANLLAIAKAGSPYLFSQVTTANLNELIRKARTMEDRAKAQLIAAWLNVVSGKLGLAIYVNVSSIPNWGTVLTGSSTGIFTVNSVLYQLDQKLAAGGLTKTQLETIKNIAEALDRQTIMVTL